MVKQLNIPPLLRIKPIVQTVFEIDVFILDIFGRLNFFLICVPTSLGWVGGRLLGTMSQVWPDFFLMASLRRSMLQNARYIICISKHASNMHLTSFNFSFYIRLQLSASVFSFSFYLQFPGSASSFNFQLQLPASASSFGVQIQL